MVHSPAMPFWTWFWLIVPAVTLLTAATTLYVRGGRSTDDPPGSSGPHAALTGRDNPGGRR
jgi:hypothetical protein